MPTEYRLRRESGREGYSFDELAKGMASDTISRGQALKLAGAAILGGGLLSSFFSKEAEAAPKCPGSGPGCTAKCKGTECICVKTTEGKKRCVQPCCSGRNCKSSADCPGAQVCSTTARKCCSRREPVCVTLCSEPNPCATKAARSADDGGWSNAA